MAASGTMTITSRKFPLTAPSAPVTAVRSASPLRTFGALSPGASVPGGNCRDVNISSRDSRSEARAAITRSRVISQATRGRSAFCFFVPVIQLSGRLNKGNFVDFFHGRDPGAHLGQSRPAQKLHALLVGRLADLRGRAFLQNQFAHTVRQVEQFMNCGAAMISS